MSVSNHEESGYDHNLDVAIRFAVIVVFLHASILPEVGAKRQKKKCGLRPTYCLPNE